MIDNLLKKLTSKLETSIINRREKRKRILVLPSICEKTRTEKLLPPKTKLVYNSTTTIKSYLRNSVTKGYPRQSGVYKVPCSACNKQYICIGESDNIDRRLQQHKNDIRNNNRNNPIVKHISELDHNVNIENASIVQFVNDIKRRKLIESFIIKNSNNFNVYQCSFNIDNATFNILLQSVPSLRHLIYSINPD